MKSSKTSIKYKFSEIEDVLGFELPSSAYNHRAWWSNDSTHSQARDGWLNVGWEVKEVDQKQEWVTFYKIPSPFNAVTTLRKDPTQEYKKTDGVYILDEKSLLSIKNSLLELNELIKTTYPGGDEKINLHFVSTIGTNLELEITELEQFIAKGIILSGNLSGLIHSVMKVFLEMQPHDFVSDKKILNKEDIKTIELMKKLLKPNVTETYDSEAVIFEEKDIDRFFSHFVITTYSYIEIYVERVLDFLLEDDFWFNRILLFLENKNETDFLDIPVRQLRKHLHNPQSLIIERIKQELPRNPYEKLKFLFKLIDTQNIIAKEMINLNLDNFMRYFAEFAKIRNMIAHQQPLPKIKKLNLPLINQHKHEIKKRLDYDLIVDQEYPDAFKPLIDVFTKWLKDVVKIYEKIDSIKMLAITFPAIMDRIIAEVYDRA